MSGESVRTCHVRVFNVGEVQISLDNGIGDEHCLPFVDELGDLFCLVFFHRGTFVSLRFRA